MDVILHLGAHRTGTSSFQDYMRRQAGPLAQQNVEFWGPDFVQGGTFADVSSDEETCTDAQARAHVQRGLEDATARGVKKLIVSDADLMGSMAQNLRHSGLYQDASAHIEAFGKRFGAKVSTVLFNSRSLELYWCSALSQAVASGHPIPTRGDLRKIAMSTRGWRDVIADIASSLTGAAIQVLPFEKCVGRPEVVLRAATDAVVPLDVKRVWLNRTPTLPALRRVLNDQGAAPSALPFGMGKWNPFTNEEHAALREMYADDMMWLLSGADGLATLAEDDRTLRAGQTPSLATKEKGHCNELEKRQVARPG